MLQEKPPAEVDLILKRGAGYTGLSEVPIAVKMSKTVNLSMFINRLKGELTKRTNNYDENSVWNYPLKLEGGTSKSSQPPLA